MIFLFWCKVCFEDAPHGERSEIANPVGAPCLCHGLTSGGSNLLLVLSGVRGWGLWRLEIRGELFNSVVMNMSFSFYVSES